MVFLVINILFEALFGFFVPENCSVYAKITGEKVKVYKILALPAFQLIFQGWLPLAQMEEEKYEQQKRDEETEKRYREDFDNWWAKYKEMQKK